MSKTDPDEQEKLIQFITQHPEGVSLKKILIFFKNAIPKRTLQYRLSHLVKSGTLESRGSGRSSKYFFKEILPTKGSSIIAPSKDSIVPFSSTAQEVQKLVSLPIQLRQHVSYRREFLESYVPNQTFYLPQGTREKLFQLGSREAEKGHLTGTYARKIYQRFLIDLSWNSSRLEGNTYSLLETEKLLETGEGIPGKDRTDTQMILNHKEAIEFLIQIAEEGNIRCYTILNIHALLSHDLLLDPKACGRLRTLPVKIGKSVYHPLEVPQLIEEYFQLIVQKASVIENPFEESFFLMVHLPYLQPFLDVNKRVSRLAGNIPFIRENLSPLSFVDVPESDYIQGLLAIYELNRIEPFRDVFVWAYERSASLYLATLEAMGEPDPFRVRYRDFIRRAISEIVQQKMNKVEGAQAIRKFAEENIASEDKKRFIAIVEFEIDSIHEGNFARFRIRPSEFFEWQKVWNKVVVFER